MLFAIDSASHVPIHLQLARQIRGAVARGRLRPGDKVPSVRDLSRQVVVNPNTIARVYGDLEHDGVLVTRAGLGVYIAPRASQLSDAARTERVTRLLDECLTEGVLLGLTREEMRQLYETRIGEFAWSDAAA
jgi:GntR family transcriptional regulator